MRPALLLPLALLASALAGAAPKSPPKKAPPASGTIRSLEVTSVTRTHLFGFLRTTLPAAAKGATQTFRGDLLAWGVKVPLAQPVKAAVQPSGPGSDVVFLVELPLASVPSELLGKASVKSVALSLEGTLAGDGGSALAVRASGALALAAPAVKAPAGLGAVFARFSGGKLSGLSLAETKGEARVALWNPFGFDIPVKSIRYRASAGGDPLASGERTGLVVHRGRENDVALPITAANAGLLSAAVKAAKAGGTLDVRVSGSVAIRVGRGEDAVLPFDVSGKVEVLP